MGHYTDSMAMTRHANFCTHGMITLSAYFLGCIPISYGRIFSYYECTAR